MNKFNRVLALVAAFVQAAKTMVCIMRVKRS